MELTLETVCVPSDDIVARKIEGEVVIVPLVAGIGDADDELYTLNEAGQAIWQQLDGQRTLGDVVIALGEEYSAPTDRLTGDVIGFASELTRRGILVAKDA